MQQLIGKLFGGKRSSSQASLLEGLGALLGGRGGGVGGLLSKFDSAGLGDKARSWVSPGSNEPISGGEVRQALGDQEVNQLAQKAGISPDEASVQLAAIIPDTVNQLTPNGQVPDQAELQQMLKSMPGT
jgi:uncharacterized protein YidB (DUF937 family)